jgi:hypothetical protein
VGGLFLLPPAPTAGADVEENRALELARDLRLLPARERALVIEELSRTKSTED